MPRSHIDIVVTQINTKRHWPKSVWRMLAMLREAEKAGAVVITLNEINKEQAMAIQALPGWDIFWVINDHLKNNSWSGNAVAWKPVALTLQKSWAKETEIRYRRGRKRDARMGPWFKKIVRQACVRLTSTNGFVVPIDIQAFHYPTRFNSDEESRDACLRDSRKFVGTRVGRKQPVVASGDGNGLVPSVPGAPCVAREGPDGCVSNGKKLYSKVLRFKLKLLSDHNGLLVKLRFTEH